MYFNRYTPATKSENLETARAFHTYNAVRNFCGKGEPRVNDFIAYCRRSLNAVDMFALAYDLEAERIWEAGCRDEWTEIRELIRNAGQPLRNTYVVYFAIIEGGVKPGETHDLVQRYSNINRATPIINMWYVEVNSKEQAQAAEHALHNIFDHARCMNRQQNKKDYYECDEASARRFITAHSADIYNAIMEAIEGI